MKIELELSDKAKKQYKELKKKHKNEIIHIISELIKDIERNADVYKKEFENKEEYPECGLGMPEPLRYELSGYWSRRIDKKNRLVYKIANKRIVIYQFCGHYNDK